MPYAIKITAYLDRNGYPVANIKNAQKFEDKQLAENAAGLANGVIAEVKEVIVHEKQVNRLETNSQTLPSKQKKLANQSWMRR